jgi:hypothetical protein
MYISTFEFLGHLKLDIDYGLRRSKSGPEGLCRTCLGIRRLSYFFDTFFLLFFTQKVFGKLCVSLNYFISKRKGIMLWLAIFAHYL